MIGTLRIGMNTPTKSRAAPTSASVLLSFTSSPPRRIQRGLPRGRRIVKRIRPPRSPFSPDLRGANLSSRPNREAPPAGDVARGWKVDDGDVEMAAAGA